MEEILGAVTWWSDTDFNAINNRISGINNVGGNVGASLGAPQRLTSTNNKINGNKNIGGNIGDCSRYSGNNGYRSIMLTVNGVETKITGNENVGGSIGHTSARMLNIKVLDAEIICTGNNVGGVVGREDFISTSAVASSNDYYSIAGANVKNVKIKGNANNVGGIAGYALGTVYACAVENETVIIANGDNAGGILGYYAGYNGTTGSQLSSSNYYLWHSYCRDSEVKAKNNTGGLVGKFVYGNIQYSYVVNTKITSESTGAGGLVGYFDNSKLSNLQYKGTIKYNYVANIIDEKQVSAGNSVGGIVGTIAKKLNYDEEIENYNNIECNLIVTDLNSYGNNISFGIGSINNNISALSQSKYMNNIYVYNCSNLNGEQAELIEKESESYSLISSEELKKNNTYTQNIPIKDEDGNIIGYKGLNFETGRYTLTSGYFPILKTKYSKADSYWENNYLNIVQQLIAIPTRKVETRNTALNTLNNSKLRSVKNMNIMNPEILPECFVYAVDIDKINIEFSKLGENVNFSIVVNGEAIIENQKINSRVYTMQYDFKSPLKIYISNGDYKEVFEYNSSDIRNMILINKDEYLYLQDNKLNSNKRAFEGEYLNIFKDKVLNSYGEIYDLNTMNLIENEDIEIKMIDNIIPISNAEFENTSISTFYHCSKIIKEDGEYTYKENQIFVKDNKLYLIDGKFKGKGNSILIDAFNDKQYESILGTDGVIYDLFSKINYPDNFKNKDIIQMTNNIDTDSKIILVIYLNGDVVGFNYITGEEVYNNNLSNKEGLLAYIKDNFSFQKLLYEINDVDYEESNKLIKKLEKVSIEDAVAKRTENSENEKNEIVEKISSNETIVNNKQNIDKDNKEINIVYNTNVNDKNILNSSEIVDKNEKDNNKEAHSNNPTVYNNNLKNTYITAYEPVAQSYVVYNTKELFSMNSSQIATENEKIKNNNLIEFYANISINKYEIKNIGIIIITIIVSTIGLILVIMYKKTNR